MHKTERGKGERERRKKGGRENSGIKVHKTRKSRFWKQKTNSWFYNHGATIGLHA